MRALKERIRGIWVEVNMQRPDPDEWWEDFEKFNPVSAQITKEFWEKNQRRLNSFINGIEARCSEIMVKRYVSYYLERLRELRREPKCAAFLRRRKLLTYGETLDDKPN